MDASHRVLDLGSFLGSESAEHCFRPDFTSKLVHVLAFGTPKFYIAPYDKIKHELFNLSSNCDVKSGLNVMKSLMDGNGNVWLPVVGISKHDTYPRHISF